MAKAGAADEIRLLHLYAQLLVNLRNRQSQEILLKNSLEEKNVLMKEIHHRAKNNLQIVSSLLNIQANTVSDPENTSDDGSGNSVIKGVAKTFLNMKYGEKAVSFFSSEYGYGSQEKNFGVFQPLFFEIYVVKKN